MDRIAEYSALIEKVLSESYYYRFPSPKPEIETLFLRDRPNNLYMLYTVGWEGPKHINNVIVLARVKDGKIWIDEDWTEEGIATDLLREGVRPADIVLAFHDPVMQLDEDPLLCIV